jgi:DNA-binding CsgD family transcriptional regulator
VGLLSNRELETLILVAQGRGNQAIANELGVTHGCIRKRLRKIYDKLQLRGRWQLIVWVLQQGLVSLDDVRLEYDGGQMASAMDEISAIRVHLWRLEKRLER